MRRIWACAWIMSAVLTGLACQSNPCGCTTLEGDTEEQLYISRLTPE